MSTKPICLSHAKYKRTMKNITLSNLIKVTFYYKICSGIKDEQAKKTAIYHSVPKIFIFLRIPLFHFIKSLSTV